MHVPSIAATYLAVLALLYAALALQVVRLRQRNRASFGDSGSSELRGAIRAHANFAEYVPIIALMAAMLEMSGLPAMRGAPVDGRAARYAAAAPVRHVRRARHAAISHLPGGRHDDHDRFVDRLRSACSVEIDVIYYNHRCFHCKKSPPHIILTL